MALTLTTMIIDNQYSTLPLSAANTEQAQSAPDKKCHCSANHPHTHTYILTHTHTHKPTENKTKKRKTNARKLTSGANHVVCSPRLSCPQPKNNKKSLSPTVPSPNYSATCSGPLSCTQDQAIQRNLANHFDHKLVNKESPFGLQRKSTRANARVLSKLSTPLQPEQQLSGVPQLLPGTRVLQGAPCTVIKKPN